MIKSYRHLVDSLQFEIPSGYIEDGESPKDAAMREFKEETGYSASKILFVGEYTLDYSMFEQKGYIFAAYDLKKNQQQQQFPTYFRIRFFFFSKCLLNFRIFFSRMNKNFK